MLAIDTVIESAKESAVYINGKYVPARLYHFDYGIWQRLRDAWEVFRGRADAVKYEGQ